MISTTPPLQQLIDMHSALLDSNPYCYFELAYTKQTKWMALICSNARHVDSNRNVLAHGQGHTPQEAAAAAIEDYCNRPGTLEVKP